MKAQYVPFVIVGLVAFVVAEVLVQGWMFSQLWEWYIRPPLHTGSITVGQAIGFSFVINFVLLSIEVKLNGLADKTGSAAARMWGTLIGTVLFFLVAALAHLIIG